VEASTYGYTEVLEALLTAGADPNAFEKGSFPLFQAASVGQADSIEVLLKHGADPNKVRV
jgi:ankyrin repeat protein